MLKKILVPLDGSTEAETVLPYVRDIAIRFDSEVDILGVGLGSKRRRVNQLLDNYVRQAVDHLQQDEITCRAVLLYSDSHQNLLDYTEVTAKPNQIKARGQILYGGPPETILAYSRDHHVNLVIMATHGISGLRRWWLGSVFEKVVSRATVPVLGIYSKQVREMDRDRKATFKRILAPLDGSETGGAAMHDAEAIALKTGASIVLVHVLPEPHAIEARWLGPEFSEFVKAMRDAGQRYLEKVEARLCAKDIDVQIRIVSGDPAGKIIEVAREGKADLIAMSTHGRSGIARWVLGSVADKILHESKIPMWLVRPRQIIKEMLKDSGQDGK